jgi:hypothetical protein
MNSTSTIALRQGIGNDALFPDEFYTVKEARTKGKFSHATCYRLINAGRLDARKLGGKTLITGASLRRLMANLPKAGRAVSIRSPEAAAA